MEHKIKKNKIFYLINKCYSEPSLIAKWVNHNLQKGHTIVLYDPNKNISFIKKNKHIKYYCKESDLQNEFNSTSGFSFLVYNHEFLNIPFDFVNSFYESSPALILGYKISHEDISSKNQYFIDENYKLKLNKDSSESHAHFYNTYTIRVKDNYLKNENISVITNFDRIFDKIESQSQFIGFPVGIPEKFELNPRKALFLDRDGIINIDKKYLKNPDQVELMPGIIDLIKTAREQKRQIFVVTNQSGIARNYYNIEDMKKVHQKISVLLKEHDLHIDKFYFSPFINENTDNDYGQFSLLRKPYPGMILLALNDYNIDIQQSYMVGDKPSDIIQYPYLKTLILKGNYSLDNVPDSIPLFENLHQIAKYIEKD